MRQGQQHARRARGRGRRPQNQNNRVFDSNGPDVKVRGTASTIAEKYINLSRDAQSSGDRVAAENYLQHAEHYQRIVAANKPPAPVVQPQPETHAQDERKEEVSAEPEAQPAVPADADADEEVSEKPPARTRRPRTPRTGTERSQSRRTRPAQTAESKNDDAGPKEDAPAAKADGDVEAA